MPQPKRHKYNAKRVELDGIKFASKKEALRYKLLRDREQRGEIRDLRLQVRFPIVINGIKVCTYIADFEYVEVASGERVVADVKGWRTDLYKLKKKLMLWVNGISILEL